jgi:hypothetical protein
MTGVVVVRAWTQRGRSSTDHLIDDTRLDECVGRRFATVEHARRAVEARADRRGYASFEYTLGSKRYVYDCSAALGIPGRDVLRIREVA